MVYLRRLGFLMVLSFIVVKGSAQAFNPKQTKLFKSITDTIFLDSLSLVPGSVQMRTYPADSLTQPAINYKYHALIFSSRRPDSILVSYKRFPYNFEKLFFHKDPSVLYADFTRANNPFTIRYNNNNGTKDNLLQNDGLNKNGNISRGISFGNNQDVVVNSNLNLQISGKLTPEIDMVMAATDNNIPFQADGTTAQLQEFDKVFIQLSNYNTKLIVGDYQLSRPQSSYFMSFYKRAQGVYLENTYKDSLAKNPLIFKTQISGAVSRGKFSRQVFFGVEANQGPYRLQGANGETFIIILSGTEKIYIDGKLLQRGQENDYIIDYNTGELTFTAKQLITKDKRIVAEFQYAERNYSRSLFFFGEEVQSRKAKFYLDVYNEQDNKNKPLQQELTQDQKNVLINAGDSVNTAFYTGVTAAPFNNSDVFYRKVDSLVAGVTYTAVYVYSTDSTVAKYRLTFSNVGANRGHYNQVSSAANGKVFVWVAPLEGVLQGSYEPVIPLVTPKKAQMVTAGFTYSFSPDHSINAEGVYTKYDVNEYSTKDKGNDEGNGVKLVSRNQHFLTADSSGRKMKFTYNGNYEYLQKQFMQIERFRSIEFDRDWNRPLNGALLNDQHLASAELGISEKRSGILYSFNLFNEGKDYSGIRHNVTANHATRNFTANYTGSYLTTKDTINRQNTQFYRHKILLSQRVNRLKFNYSDVFEHNLFIKPRVDSLLPRSYQFWEWEASVQNADSSKTNVKLFYRQRRDKLAYSPLDLKDSTFATNIGLNASIFAIKNNPITVLVTYRKLELRHVVGTYLQPDNTLLNRVEYNPRYFKGLITSNIFYETGYGLQNKQEFYYLEVAPGQGQYAWIDYNNNGIKELNEFEVSKFSDQAKYIRIYTPTNQYVKVLQNQLSISFNIRPSSLFRSPKKAIERFANRWILQTAMQLDNKISDNKNSSNYNPFAKIKDTFLIAANNNIRQSLFFNQSSAVFGADYTYINNKSKQLLTSSIEQKTIESHEIKSRINFLKAWAINSSGMLSYKGNRSQLFTTRNFYIRGYDTEHKLSYQPNTVFRISTIYKYSNKENTIASDLGVYQKAMLNTFGLEMKYNQTEKGSLTANINYINIKYNGDLNSSIAYEMLNGLSPGNNFTWEVTYMRNLKSNIQISINYNGRKTSGAGAVHLGGAQIRAFF